MGHRHRIFLSGLLGLLGCNDAQTVDPKTPSSTPISPAEPTQPKPPTQAPMPSDPDPQTHALGIADASFFDGSANKAMAAARRELRKAGTPTLRIDAPFAVDAATESTLPVLGIFGRSTADENDLERSSIVVAVDLARGGFHAASALRSPKLADDDGGSREGSADAFVVSSFELDVFERLPEVPRTGTTHQIYVLAGEHLSNGVGSTLSGEAATGSVVVPSTLVAQTTAHADSPALPATAGVRLSVPSHAVSEPGGSLTLRGSVRANGETTRVFLLATSDNSADPLSFTVDVPLTDGVGYFNIDIVADEGPPKHPAQWHWYAFSGEHSAGPASVRLDPGKPW